MSVINKIIQIKTDLGQATAEIKTLFNDLLKNQIKTTEQQEKLNDEFKTLNKTADKTHSGIDSIARSFKGMGLAIKAAGIGLLISSFQTFKDIAFSSQGVVDGLSTSMNFLKIAFNNAKEAITENGEESKTTGDKIKNFLLNGVLQATKVSENFGKTLSSLVKGNFKEAGEALTNIAFSYADVIAGSDGATKSVLEQAKELTKLDNSYEKSALLQENLALRLETSAEKLRQQRDNEDLSIKNRIKANTDLGKILETQSAAELTAVDSRIAGKQKEIELLGNTVENENALLRLQNERQQVLNKITGQQSEQQANRFALSKEEKELIISVKDAESERYLSGLEFQQELEKTELGRLAKEKIFIDESQKQILTDLEVKKGLYAEGTQVRADAEQDYLNKKLELDQRLASNQQAIYDEQLALEEELFLQREDLRQRELEAQQIFEDAKFAVAQGGLDLVRTLASDSKGLALSILAVEKGLAAAQVVVEASRSIATQTAASQAATKAQIFQMSLITPFPANIAAAGGITATNTALLAKGIAATKLTAGASLASILAASITGAKGITGGASGGGGGGGAGASAAPAPQAQFNIVGQSQTNQLAETIGAAQNKPVNAYVVGSDMTTQQALDRNRITTATFLALLPFIGLFLFL
jgi:hypothetical protein